MTERRPALEVAFVVGSAASYRVLNTLVDLTAGGEVKFVPVAFGNDDGPLLQDMADRGVPVARAGELSLPGITRGSWRLRRILRQLRPDIVHSNLFLPATATELARLGWRQAPPSVLNRHHNLQHHYQHRPLHRMIDGWSARHASAVVAVSGAVADTLARREHVPRSKIVVVHNGVDWAGFEPRHDAVQGWRRRYPGRHLLVAVGRLDVVKDLPTMLEALVAVRERQPQALLLLAGEGPERESVERRVAELGLSGHVELLGHVSDVPSLLGAADVFVQASLDEACPQSISEALGLGVPVAVTTTGGTTELLDGSGHPEIPAGRPDLLARRVLDVLEDREQQGVLAAAYAEVIRDRLSAERMLAAYERVYRQLVTPSRRASM